jgi:hypothetical protein
MRKGRKKTKATFGGVGNDGSQTTEKEERPERRVRRWGTTRVGRICGGWRRGLAGEEGVNAGSQLLSVEREPSIGTDQVSKWRNVGR